MRVSTSSQRLRTGPWLRRAGAAFLVVCLLGLAMAVPAAHASLPPIWAPAGGEVVPTNNTGLTVGIIVGAVAILGGLGFLFLFLKRRKDQDDKNPPPADGETAAPAA